MIEDCKVAKKIGNHPFKLLDQKWKFLDKKEELIGYTSPHYTAIRAEIEKLEEKSMNEKLLDSDELVIDEIIRKGQQSKAQIDSNASENSGNNLDSSTHYYRPSALASLAESLEREDSDFSLPVLISEDEAREIKKSIHNIRMFYNRKRNLESEYFKESLATENVQDTPRLFLHTFKQSNSSGNGNKTASDNRTSDKNKNDSSQDSEELHKEIRSILYGKGKKALDTHESSLTERIQSFNKKVKSKNAWGSARGLLDSKTYQNSKLFKNIDDKGNEIKADGQHTPKPPSSPRNSAMANPNSPKGLARARGRVVGKGLTTEKVKAKIIAAQEQMLTLDIAKAFQKYSSRKGYRVPLCLSHMKIEEPPQRPRSPKSFRVTRIENQTTSIDSNSSLMISLDNASSNDSADSNHRTTGRLNKSMSNSNDSSFSADSKKATGINIDLSMEVRVASIVPENLSATPIARQELNRSPRYQTRETKKQSKLFNKADMQAFVNSLDREDNVNGSRGLSVRKRSERQKIPVIDDEVPTSPFTPPTQNVADNDDFNVAISPPSPEVGKYLDVRYAESVFPASNN